MFRGSSFVLRLKGGALGGGVHYCASRSSLAIYLTPALPIRARMAVREAGLRSARGRSWSAQDEPGVGQSSRPTVLGAT
jgi:hypothetical protein